jgi:archaellum component FlaC
MRRLKATERRKKAAAEAKEKMERLEKEVESLAGIVEKLKERPEDTVMGNTKHIKTEGAS